MAKALQKFTDRLPNDLARVAGKGLKAEEAFLNLMDEEEVSEEKFRRSYAFAKIGSRAVGRAVSFLQAMNNRDAIELQRKRIEHSLAATES